ncbi:MAG: hypothetical protein E6J41_09230 [Chloroflexi bacterium]|nr:MAG: hypothetical protein E6J41_09230 [Chloroflexota bacterium]
MSRTQWTAARGRSTAQDPQRVGGGRPAERGLSDRPTEPDGYADEVFAADAVAVMDATRTPARCSPSSSLQMLGSAPECAGHADGVMTPRESEPTALCDEAPDLQTQFEDLLHGVWLAEANWRMNDRIDLATGGGRTS